MQRLSIYFLALVFSVPFETIGQQNSEAVGQTPSDVAPVSVTANPNSAPFIIRNIIITGNKKTQPSVILREIPFKPGDKFQLQKLVEKFEQARKLLMNTTLFHEVVVALKSFEGYNVDIIVDVRERWYIFPVPYFKMVDRNLNQWLVENKASFQRVNYGIKILHNNVSGFNDKMQLVLMNGYSKQLLLKYDRPFFDKKMKWGARAGLFMGKSREVSYETLLNKEVFLKDTNRFIRNFLRTNFEVTYRRAIKTRHRFGIGYIDEKVHDTIVKLNPAYFTNERTHINFPELYYDMSYYDVDYIPYPLKGFETKIYLSKKGFNKTINIWEMRVNTGNYWQLLPKTYLSVNSMGVLKLPFKQPFFNSRLMGYGEMFMQGYEYFVIDGVAGGCVKTTFSRQLFDFRIPMPRIKKRTLNAIPFKIYGKIYGNTGYVYNPEPGINHLTNKMLYSGGVGIDIVTLYDVNIRIDWSFNQLGQNGIYLHRKSNF